MITTEYKDNSILHLGALEMLMASDQALAFAPEMDISEPHRLQDVTIEWLEKILGADVPAAKLLELIDTDAHAGMTDRKKWKLVWNAAGQSANLPTAIFIKATPHLPKHREMLSVLHMDEAEAKFYRHIHPEISALAPKAYYCRSYGGGRSIIVLEDIAERGCVPFWQGHDCSIEHAKAVVVTQAKFHAKFWGSERLLGDLNWIRPRTRRFGWPWLYAAHQAVRKTFLDQATEQELPAAARSVLQTWHENAQPVYNYWDTMVPTLLHGDSHLGNTFSNPDGSAGYYDWQVIFAGPGLRDLSYFLMSALTNEQRREHERGIFELYLATLAEGGVVLDQETAWNDYCIFALDRWDATIMSFIHGTYNHALTGQLRIFKTIAGAMIDNDVAGRLESLLRGK